jgi:Zinc finger, C3HC4 type (RING finger)
MNQSEEDNSSVQNYSQQGDISVESQHERILNNSPSQQKQAVSMQIQTNPLALLMNSQKEEVFDLIEDNASSEKEKISSDLKADLILETNLLLMLMASGLVIISIVAFIFHFYASLRILLGAGILHLWGPGLLASVIMFKWTSASFRMRTRYAVLIYEMLNRILFTAELVVVDGCLVGWITHGAPFWAIIAGHGLFLIFFGVYCSAKNIRCCMSIATLLAISSIASIGIGLVPTYSYQDLTQNGFARPLMIFAILLGIFVLSSLVVVSFRFKSNDSSINAEPKSKKETTEQRNLRLKNLELEQEGNLPLGLLFFFLIGGMFASFFLLDFHVKNPENDYSALISSISSLVLFCCFLTTWRYFKRQINFAVAASFGFNMFKRRILLRDGPVMKQISPTFFAPAIPDQISDADQMPDLELGLRKHSTDSVTPFRLDLHRSANSCKQEIQNQPPRIASKFANSTVPLSADRVPPSQEIEDSGSDKRKKTALSRISKVGKRHILARNSNSDEGSPQKNTSKAESDIEETKCNACMSQTMELLFLPCNHGIFCQQCFDLHIKNSRETASLEEEYFRFICPVCRGPIAGVCRFEWLDKSNKQFKITEDLTGVYKKLIQHTAKIPS